jgi:hypothetical protein
MAIANHAIAAIFQSKHAAVGDARKDQPIGPVIGRNLETALP